MRIDETVLLSSLVRHLSEHNGESQAKVAARADRSQSMVSHIEHNDYQWTSDSTNRAIAEALDLPSRVLQLRFDPQYPPGPTGFPSFGLLSLSVSHVPSVQNATQEAHRALSALLDELGEEAIEG